MPIPVERTVPDLIDLPRDEVETLLGEHFARQGQPGYRVTQTLAWIHERDAADFHEMTDLPAAQRAALADAFQLTAPELAVLSRSADGTAKQLWRLGDGELIESVLIPAQDRLTLCISSQAGCAMGCVFCATGWSGYRRQLTAGEIVAQFRGARRWAAGQGLGAISNIVFMGMGEPLANTPAVMRSLTLLNHAYRFGARRITVSTVGMVPGILELASRPEQFGLAVSLHAPESTLRARLVPVEKKYPLSQLLEALRSFHGAGGRRITFEYVLIGGVNDGTEQARQLVSLVREFGAHVNLIPFNPIPGTDWRPPSAARIHAFASVLEQGRVAATVREARGLDIAAACGQLRAEHETRPPRPWVQLMATTPGGATGP